jgi:hypothetical protein
MKNQMKPEPQRSYFIKPESVEREKIDINLYDAQPLPSYGYRTGHWRASYQGQAFRFYWSIPQYLEPETALDLLKGGAAHCIENGWTEE